MDSNTARIRRVDRPEEDEVHCYYPIGVPESLAKFCLVQSCIGDGGKPWNRALDAVREKWEAREQRALDEVDRLREDRARWGDTDALTLTGQLEEAQEEQYALKWWNWKEAHLCSHLED